jgi:hypothetical protein
MRPMARNNKDIIERKDGKWKHGLLKISFEKRIGAIPYQKKEKDDLDQGRCFAHPIFDNLVKSPCTQYDYIVWGMSSGFPQPKMAATTCKNRKKGAVSKASE